MLLRVPSCCIRQIYMSALYSIVPGQARCEDRHHHFSCDYLMFTLGSSATGSRLARACAGRRLIGF